MGVKATRMVQIERKYVGWGIGRVGWEKGNTGQNQENPENQNRYLGMLLLTKTYIEMFYKLSKIKDYSSCSITSGKSITTALGYVCKENKLSCYIGKRGK